ncbi:MAG: patatin-like phospholipase family protein [bacterium]|nr:patatin-like phospholipase family protein [bacterium]
MKALVLGGGAARGFAHIGIIKKLEEQKAEFDIITGNSMGGLIGAFLAMGKKSKDLEKILRDISWVSMISKPGRGYLQSGEALEKILEEHFGNKRIEQLKIPFACIACDIDTGEEVVLGKGKIKDAVRATISIPGVFKPHRLNDRFLVDGGIVNNLPILQAEKMGAKDILAINVRRPKNRKTEISEYLSSTKGPWEKLISHFGPSLFYDAIEKSYDILSNTLDEKQMRVKKGTRLTVIQVNLGDTKYRDFLKWEQIVKMGEDADLSSYSSATTEISTKAPFGNLAT